MAVAAGLGAAGAVGVFDYNRKNFLFDRKLRQETEYKIMDFRIRQAELWREDVRDIVGLTAVKMDTYLVLNTVQLGFCVMAFCEGRLALGTPSWLIGCHTLSLAGAFMYLLMSVWLAMQASVTAKSYETRLLTQLVRLPVPTWAQLEGARTYASSFEKVESRQMFRVPFLRGGQESVLERGGVGRGAPQSQPEVSSRSPSGMIRTRNDGSQTETESEVTTPEQAAGRASDLWGLEGRGDGLYELDAKARADPSQLRHLCLVREAMQYWQAFDGFARVSMSLGTNQLINGMAYYVLGYVLISNHAIIASWFAVGLFMSIAAALVRLDMSLTTFEYRVSVVLVTIGPFITAIACQRWVRLGFKAPTSDYVLVSSLMSVVFAIHSVWLLYILHISKVSEQKGGSLLPTGFRSVMYIDVFGWISKTMTQQRRKRAQVGPVGEVRSPTPGSGPAVQCVNYDDTGRPVPSRPETLPGGERPLESVQVNEDDFVPTTFVPCAKDKADDPSRFQAATLRPGFVPWRIFCSSTVMLAMLWWVFGASQLWQCLNASAFEVQQALNLEELLGSDNDHNFRFLQKEATIVEGEPIPTSWPHAGVRPRGLTCGGDESGLIVASTKFNLFVAQLHAKQSALQVSGHAKINVSALTMNFEATPLCQDVEGESLQDVTVQCDGNLTEPHHVKRRHAHRERHCSALVLHRQGQQLSACPLRKALETGGVADVARAPPGAVAAAWLQEASGVDSPQEEVSAMVLGGATCHGGAFCAYAQTTFGRIVELRAEATASVGSSADQTSTSWFPARVLQTDGLGAFMRESEGGLSIVGKGRRYLTVLHPRTKVLEAVDLREAGTRDSMEGLSDSGLYWRLPADRQWLAACSSGDNLYMLAEGLSPQLWRFPLPQVLRGEVAAAKEEAPAHIPRTIAKAAPAASPFRLRASAVAK